MLIISTLAKIEREKIFERTKSGLRQAIAKGKKIGHSQIPDKIRNKVKQLLESGTGIRETAMFNISPTFISIIRNATN